MFFFFVVGRYFFIFMLVGTFSLIFLYENNYKFLLDIEDKKFEISPNVYGRSD